MRQNKLLKSISYLLRHHKNPAASHNQPPRSTAVPLHIIPEPARKRWLQTLGITELELTPELFPSEYRLILEMKISLPYIKVNIISNRSLVGVLDLVRFPGYWGIDLNNLRHDSKFHNKGLGTFLVNTGIQLLNEIEKVDLSIPIKSTLQQGDLNATPEQSELLHARRKQFWKRFGFRVSDTTMSATLDTLRLVDGNTEFGTPRIVPLSNWGLTEGDVDLILASYAKRQQLSPVPTGKV